MSQIKKNYIFVGVVKENHVTCLPKMYAKQTQQILIVDSLIIFVFDITKSYFLPDHICTLSRIIFADECAWQFVTIELDSGSNTP